jgi:leucyl aminopeptidase
MHWTQEKYNTEVMIELSTLTGAIISALGSYHAGLFSNSDNLSNDLIAAGNQVH